MPPMFQIKYPPPPLNSRRLPPGEDCGKCWHLENGLGCLKTKYPKIGNSFTDYCHWPTNHFTKEPVQIEAPYYKKPAKTEAPLPEFSGNKDELVLHEVLARAKYRCECDGGLCKRHEGRCTALHVKAGGKTTLLLQPKNAKKSHSLENSKAMCAGCATANTSAQVNIKSKKKSKPDEAQQTIV